MMILITGGSGSGKSAYAEQLVTEFGDFNRIYIATMYPFDEESHKRIKRHRNMRARKQFTTVECYTCLLYTSPSPRDGLLSRMPSSA